MTIERTHRRPPPPPPPPPPPAPKLEHTVKPGDNLTAIAKQHGVTLPELLKANPQIQNPDLIRPGQTLRLPAAPAVAPATRQAVDPAQQSDARRMSAAADRQTAGRVGNDDAAAESIKPRRGLSDVKKTDPAAAAAEATPAQLREARAERQARIEESRRVDPQALAAGQQAIAAAADDVDGANDGSDDDKRAAGLAGAKAIKEALAQAPNEATRKAILEQSESALGTITGGLDKLTGDQNKTAFADLSAAGELAGPDGVDALTKPMAAALPSMIEGHGDNDRELTDSLQDAIQGGHGALFAASLGKQLEGVSGANTPRGLLPSLADDVKGATTRGLEDVKKSFGEAMDAREGKDAELATVARQWGDALTPDQMTAGINRFRDENSEYADSDQAAETLASSLQGARYAQQHASGDLEKAGGAALSDVTRLATTEPGAAAVGKALVAQGEGRPTFLEGARDVVTGDEEKEQAFTEALQRSVLQETGTDLSSGNNARVLAALEGAKAIAPNELGRRGFGGLATSLEHLSATGAQADRIAVDLAAKSRSLAGEFSALKAETPEASLKGSTSFQVFGASLGTVALGQNLLSLRDGVTAREAVGTVVSAAGLGESVAGLALKEGAPKLLSKGLPVVGYALSAWDTARAIEKGDAVGAVAAAAPLAGAAAGAAIGAATGSVAPGVGTVIGGAVGALVGIGIHVGRGLFEDSPEEAVEKSTQSFLQGALEEGGLSAEQAEIASHRLRDVNEDFTSSAGALTELSRALGQTPNETLMRAARLDDDTLHDLVKDALDSGDGGTAALVARWRGALS